MVATTRKRGRSEPAGERLTGTFFSLAKGLQVFRNDMEYIRFVDRQFVATADEAVWLREHPAFGRQYWKGSLPDWAKKKIADQARYTTRDPDHHEAGYSRRMEQAEEA